MSNILYKQKVIDLAENVKNIWEKVNKSQLDELLNTKEKQKMILTESKQIENYEILYLGGIYTIADQENQNGRTYKEETCDNGYGKYQTDYIQKKRAYGETMHPEYLDADLNRVSMRVINIEKKGKLYNGKSMIVPTTAGKEIMALVKTGGVVGVSTRGIGDIHEDGNKNTVENWEIFAVDIVGNPSVAEAIQDRLNESKINGEDKKIKKYKEISNSISRILDKETKIKESLKLFYYIINTL